MPRSNFSLERVSKLAWLGVWPDLTEPYVSLCNAPFPDWAICQLCNACRDPHNFGTTALICLFCLSPDLQGWEIPNPEEQIRNRVVYKVMLQGYVRANKVKVSSPSWTPSYHLLVLYLCITRYVPPGPLSGPEKGEPFEVKRIFLVQSFFRGYLAGEHFLSLVTTLSFEF